MHGDERGDAPYAVVVAELGRAARDMRAITESARDGVLEALPQVVGDTGDDGLTTAFADYCARWDTGLSHLVGDSETVAQRLEATAASYTREAYDTAHAFDAQRCPAPTPYLSRRGLH